MYRWLIKPLLCYETRRAQTYNQLVMKHSHIHTNRDTQRERERERCWLERGEVVRGTFGEFCNHPCDIWALLSPFLAPSSNFCILKHKTKTCIRLSMVNLGIKKHMLTLPSHHRISKQQIRTIKSIQQQLDLTLMSFYSVCGWGHLMLGVNSKALLSIVPSAPLFSMWEHNLLNKECQVKLQRNRADVFQQAVEVR